MSRESLSLESLTLYNCTTYGYMLPREDPLARAESTVWDTFTTLLTGAIGAGIGLVVGFIASELIGEVDSVRVKRAMGRFTLADSDSPDSDELEREITNLLEANPTTRDMDIVVRALGNGVAEISGTAPNRSSRDLAGKLARSATGASTVVNRILVHGVDVPAKPRVSTAGNS